MKPEEVFGVNAGKVWLALKDSPPLSVQEIAKKTNLKINDVYGALGWLGREGKIEIIKEKKRTLYRLTE